MIAVYDSTDTLLETRRGEDVRYAAKRVAHDYDATIRRLDDDTAVLMDSWGRRMIVQVTRAIRSGSAAEC